MLIGGIVAVVLVVGVTAAVVLRRRSRDDVHSVEHYHRQLHTLEEMRAHPARGDGGEGDDGGEPAYPPSAFRVTGTPTVRLTDATGPLVPPVPPPPVSHLGEPVTFEEPGTPHPSPAVASGRREERAMDKINHRPRRLGAPLAAVGAVIVLVVVLILTGLHSNTPTHHGKSADTATTVRTHPPSHSHPRHPTTTTTAPPLVSTPQAATQHVATYQVGASSYTLLLAATSGECWVEATDGATGSVLFTGTLFSGQSHSVSATGAVTVIAGAPGAFTATVNGSSVTLPVGFQAPFTLKFVPPAV